MYGEYDCYIEYCDSKNRKFSFIVFIALFYRNYEMSTDRRVFEVTAVFATSIWTTKKYFNLLEQAENMLRYVFN